MAVKALLREAESTLHWRKFGRKMETLKVIVRKADADISPSIFIVEL